MLWMSAPFVDCPQACTFEGFSQNVFRTLDMSCWIKLSTSRHLFIVWIVWTHHHNHTFYEKDMGNFHRQKTEDRKRYTCQETSILTQVPPDGTPCLWPISPECLGLLAVWIAAYLSGWPCLNMEGMSYFWSSTGTMGRWEEILLDRMNVKRDDKDSVKVGYIQRDKQSCRDQERMIAMCYKVKEASWICKAKTSGIQS